MKYIPLFVLVLMFMACNPRAKNHVEQVKQYKTIQVNRYGYKDSAGKVIIKPIYLSADEFSEEVADVRVDGSYGYIDKTGKFVIEPQFDFATPFKNDLALVFKNSRPFYIHKNGQMAFNCNYRAIGLFEGNLAAVRTYSGKTGMIDRTGKLRVDTAFAHIDTFINNRAVVYGFGKIKTWGKFDGRGEMDKIGVIDTTGKFIINYGRFYLENDIGGAFFKVTIPVRDRETKDGYDSDAGFTDRDGKLVVVEDEYSNDLTGAEYENVYIEQALYKADSLHIGVRNFKTEKCYRGKTSSKGYILIHDSLYRQVAPFKFNRAFVEDFKGRYWLVDMDGNMIIKRYYNSVGLGGFIYDAALVECENNWIAIDTNGVELPDPRPVAYDPLKSEGLVRFKRDSVRVEIEAPDTTLPAKLVSVYKHCEFVNVDYMMEGYFNVSSAWLAGYDTTSHWYKKANFPRKVNPGYNFYHDSLGIYVKTDERGIFNETYKGFTVYLANTTKDTVSLRAQDGRLYMNLQAINENGQWQDIECLPSSWCGNSYSNRILWPGYFWQFTAPCYAGDFKTRLRIKLSHYGQNNWLYKQNPSDKKVVYSNEFDGTINRAQFWRRWNIYSHKTIDVYEYDNWDADEVRIAGYTPM